MAEIETINRQEVTIDDVNRILEIGRLLLTVLTPDEIQELQRCLPKQSEFFSLDVQQVENR
jgi:hypothetical protein